MAQVINTNVLSLNAQRNLSTSGSQLATALQRLSSGLRINSAKDDAAGLAISSRFTTQINGLNQAARNANDGISLAQTAESALGELTANLQRIRELAVQSANASNSASDRAALDQEVQQRIAEINRIASQTSFNGQKVLDGTFGNATFQVGANVGETIEVGLNTNMKASAIGQLYSATGSVDLSTLFVTGATPATPSDSGAGGAFTTAEAGNAGETFVFTVGGVEVLNVTAATANDEVTAADIDTALTAATAALTAAGISFTGTAAGNDLTFTKADGTDFDIVITTDFSDAAGGWGNWGATESVTNGTPADPGTPTNLTLGSVTLAVGTAQAVDLAGTYESMDELVGAINSQVAGVYATVNDSNQLVITAGEELTIGGAAVATVGLVAGTLTASGSLDDANVQTTAGANDAILRVDAALTAVSAFRSTLGAIQGRFESTIANLHSVSENLQASRSRILDADFASETASLTRAQILQQAGIAILAQANAVPQNVLALLR